MWPYWYARGHLTEGSRWLDTALRLSTEVTHTRVRALTGAGVLAHYQGLYSRAAALCGESLALSRARDDAMGIANALHGLALVARSRGEFASARQMYEEARTIHAALGDQ